jgi:hypothetical protein
MRVVSSSSPPSSGSLASVLALAVVLVAGSLACGNGGATVKLKPDSARPDAADAAADGEVEPEARDVADAPDDESLDVVDAGADAADTLDADGDGGGATEAGPMDAPADVVAEVGTDARQDVPVERPSATASWTIAPNAMCTAAGAGCMDTGAVGGYQITASGTCPTASSIQLWFPGGATPLAAGTYAVKAAAGILDVIAMPAGMVGVLAERDDTAQMHLKYWGRAGTATVTASGASRRVTFAGVTLREETTSALTTLTADVTCP